MPVDAEALELSLEELRASTTRAVAVESLSRRLKCVISVSTDLLHVDGVGLTLLDRSGHARAVAANSASAMALDAAQQAVWVGPGIDTLQRGATVAVADVAEQSSYVDLWRALSGRGVRAVLSTPIRVSAAVVGNLNAVAANPHEWTASEERAGEAFAGIVGQMLELASVIAARSIFEPDPPRR